MKGSGEDTASGQPSSGAPLLLAGDVGATKTNLALFTFQRDALDLVSERSFRNADYAALAEVVRAFLDASRRTPEAVCFGVAGPVADGRARAFCAKGRFVDWLRAIPVRVILDPTTALRGAAMYLATLETEGRSGCR